uniref:Uncharacterized protein n=1 Tax=Spironucleus salmonicida TaxID=348837 RepID=V6LHS3_9EUKA|eukprot:EST43853.1 Hypothetical protein SS50377_16397 [Spironucleus salmonicida]
MACEEDLWGQQVGSQLGSLSMVIWAYAIVGWQITALQVDLEKWQFQGWWCAIQCGADKTTSINFIRMLAVQSSENQIDGIFQAYTGDLNFS